MTRIATIFTGILSVLASGCVAPNQHREIPYDSRVPIADRLVATDKEVLVNRDTSGADAPFARVSSYDDEMQRLRSADIVALVRVAGLRGELVSQGVWIETTVTAHVDQMLRSSIEQATADSMEFTFSGGETHIGSVAVTAGPFPLFHIGEQYLVVLAKHPRMSVISALHVNASGELESLSASSGTAKSQTPLIGRKASEIVESLRGK